MIRVMVVEDEPPIAQSIKRLVEEYGEAEVTHIAINGRRALEYLEDHKVELVFSDIKMPVMDGIELARLLQEKYPEVIMVIISGFQEFEFARSAIRYGVNNYLLKPISREHMADVMKEACSLIRRRRENQNRAMLEHAVHSDSAAAKQGGAECCGVLLIYCGPYPLVPDGNMLDNPERWGAAEIEEWLSSLLEKGEACICVHGRNVYERAAVISAESVHTVEKAARTLYEQMASGVDCLATIAFYNELISLQQVGETITRLRKCVYKQTRLLGSQLLPYNNDVTGVSLEAPKEQNKLVLALRNMDADLVERAIGEFVDAYVNAEARQSEFVLCMEKILLTVYDGHLSMSQMEEAKFDLHSVISTSLQPAELKEELSQVLCSWSGVNSQADKDNDEKLCESVAAYLRTNFKECIRGADLVKEFSYSSSQLSKKFKYYFGLTISEYMIKYRIETAQAIMRNNRKLKIKEIAIEVGFKDQYYFSKTFKKLTGNWPSEYMQEDHP